MGKKSESEEDEHKESFGLVEPAQEEQSPHSGPSFVLDGSFPTGSSSSNTRIVHVAGLGSFETPCSPEPEEPAATEGRRTVRIALDRAELADAARRQAEAHVAAAEVALQQERELKEEQGDDPAASRWGLRYQERRLQLQRKRSREEVQEETDTRPKPKWKPRGSAAQEPRLFQ